MMRKLFNTAVFTIVFIPLSFSQDLLWTIETDTLTFNAGKELVLDNNDNIYIGTSGMDLMGLMKLDKDGIYEFAVEELETGPINAMISDDNGKIYQVGSRNNGVIPADGLLKVYYPDGNTHFTQTYDYQNKSDKFEDVCLDNSNNIYVGGHGYNSLIEQQAITIKYAPDGTPLWAQEYGLVNRNCRNLAIKVNEAGEVFTMGIIGPTSPGMVEIICLKYSAVGTHIWTFPWSVIGYPDCYPLFFLMDADDNIYVGGYASNSSNEDVAFIFKMANGSLVWSHQMTSPGQSASYLTAAFDSEGNIVCAGTYENANTDAHFVKYSPSDGSLLKQGFYNSPYDMNDGFFNMCVKDEFIYFCGTSEGIGTDRDMIAMKVNSEFDTIWNIRFNSFSNGFDHANQIRIDSEDNVVLTGFTISTAGYFCRVWKYSNPLGIADHGYNETHLLDVYPNPVSSTLYFQHTTENKDATYAVINNTGQVVLSAEVPAGPTQEIDLSSLTPGTYFLQILDGNKKYHAKLVKQ